MVEYIDNMLTKYYNYLSRRGYYNYNEVYKMLFIIAIYKMSLEMGEFIDSKDAKMFINSIECIMGTDCLFDVEPIHIQKGIYTLTLGNKTINYNIDDLIRMINEVKEDIPINVSQLNNDAGYLQSDLI